MVSKKSKPRQSSPEPIEVEAPPVVPEPEIPVVEEAPPLPPVSPNRLRLTNVGRHTDERYLTAVIADVGEGVTALEVGIPVVIKAGDRELANDFPAEFVVGAGRK